MATANSSIVSKIKMVNVIRAVVMLMEIRVRTALLIRCINRCPAVMLAVSRIARATG